MKSLGVLSVAILAQTALSASLPNVPATFGNSPQPFTLNVNQTFIKEVHDRVKAARAPVSLKNLSPADADGPSFEEYNNVREYWVNTFDWNSTQASLNKRFKHFTTTVRTPRSNYTHPVPLHFVHHKSPRADAIPLLFIHGWPGSFLEVGKIIDRLTNPPNSSVPAFHVVAPSIPGFGFSPAAEYTGYGPTEAAHSFNSLMQQLNYTKYVINGGDFGGVILRLQAALYPKTVLSALCNFWVIEPSAADLRRYQRNQTTPDETLYISNINRFDTFVSGYRFVQQNIPLTLAYGMSDTPLGFAMWIYSLMRQGVDPTDFAFSPQEIITWSLMYYIQGPYGGFRFYKEVQNEGLFSGFGFGSSPYVTQPVAINEFPYDIWFGLPLDWAQREGNVKERYVHDHGGHFAAYELPGVVADDMWRWFGGLKLNATA